MWKRKSAGGLQLVETLATPLSVRVVSAIFVKLSQKKGSPFQPRSFLCTFSSPEPLGLKIKTTTVDEEPMTKSTLAHALVRQTAATN